LSSTSIFYCVQYFHRYHQNFISISEPRLPKTSAYDSVFIRLNMIQVSACLAFFLYIQSVLAIIPYGWLVSKHPKLYTLYVYLHKTQTFRGLLTQDLRERRVPSPFMPSPNVCQGDHLMSHTRIHFGLGTKNWKPHVFQNACEICQCCRSSV